VGYLLWGKSLKFLPACVPLTSFQVFKKIEKQLPQLTTLDLQYVSPSLLRARNLELAVPGKHRHGPNGYAVLCCARHIPEQSAYHNDCELCNQVICHIFEAKTTSTIASRKRRAGLPIRSQGYDVCLYSVICLLRNRTGHEDLRQDERVMQLFSLINNLLVVDTDGFQRRLHIQRYHVVPLAPNAGLIGWVQDSDTLHVLVRDYREARKILLNIEYRLMLQVCNFGFPSKQGLSYD
jgi:serine/threonine-protein kinase mTOR